MTKSSSKRGTFLKAGIAAKTARVINQSIKSNIPEFQAGDSVKVHARIVEGTKERIQIFEGVVIARHRRNAANATFTVRKISYNMGVERTFMLHSPRVEKIEIMTRGIVRRAKLYYLRDLAGKKGKVKTEFSAGDLNAPASETSAEVEEAASVA